MSGCRPARVTWLALALACAAPSPRPTEEPGAEPGAAPAVIALPAPSHPAVAIQLQFRSGSIDDPAGKEGLTALTAALMAEGGTERLSARELVRALYPMAAELEAISDQETTVFAGRCPREALDRFLPLVEEVVLRPRLDPEQLERLRRRALDGLERTIRAEDDDELARAALSQLVYRDHPYRHPVQGTVQGLRSITLEDVRAQWRRVFVASRLTVGAAGGYPDDLPGRLARDLSVLPAGRPRPPAPAPPPPGPPRFLLVEKPSSPTSIAIGLAWDVKRGDPDFPALVAAVSALGEHRQGASFRLFRELRERRGLSYAYAYPEHFVPARGSALPAPNHPRSHQELTVRIRPVEPPHRLFALRAALREIDRWARQGLTAEELERVKRFLGGYTLTFDQSDARRLGYALDDRFYGLARPWLETLRARLPSLTLEEVNGALRRHVDPAGLRIAVATHGAAELAAAIRSGVPSPISYPAKKPPEVLAADAAIERFPLGVSGPQDVKVVQAEELFR